MDEREDVSTDLRLGLITSSFDDNDPTYAIGFSRQNKNFEIFLFGFLIHVLIFQVANH
jgi:hypothetical protein